MIESATHGRWARLMIATCTLMLPAYAIGGDGRLARKRLEFTMMAGNDSALAIGREVESAVAEAAIWHSEHPTWGPLNVIVPVGSMPAYRSDVLQGVAVVDDWDVCDGFGHLMAKAQHLAAGHLSELIAKGKVVMDAAASLSAAFDDDDEESSPARPLPDTRKRLPPPYLGRDWWQSKH